MAIFHSNIKNTRVSNIRAVAQNRPASRFNQAHLIHFDKNFSFMTLCKMVFPQSEDFIEYTYISLHEKRGKFIVIYR